MNEYIYIWYVYICIYNTWRHTHTYIIMMTLWWHTLIQAPDLLVSDVFPLRLCGPLADLKTDYINVMHLIMYCSVCYVYISIYHLHTCILFVCMLQATYMLQYDQWYGYDMMIWYDIYIYIYIYICSRMFLCEIPVSAKFCWLVLRFESISGWLNRSLGLYRCPPQPTQSNVLVRYIHTHWLVDWIFSLTDWVWLWPPQCPSFVFWVWQWPPQLCVVSFSPCLCGVGVASSRQSDRQHSQCSAVEKQSNTSPRNGT